MGWWLDRFRFLFGFGRAKQTLGGQERVTDGERLRPLDAIGAYLKIS